MGQVPRASDIDRYSRQITCTHQTTEARRLTRSGHRQASRCCETSRHAVNIQLKSTDRLCWLRKPRTCCQAPAGQNPNLLEAVRKTHTHTHTPLAPSHARTSNTSGVWLLWHSRGYIYAATGLALALPQSDGSSSISNSSTDSSSMRALLVRIPLLQAAVCTHSARSCTDACKLCSRLGAPHTGRHHLSQPAESELRAPNLGCQTRPPMTPAERAGSCHAHACCHTLVVTRQLTHNC